MRACLDELADAGLLTRTAGRAVLTRRGRLFANEVGARVLAAAERDAAPASADPGTR